MKIKGSSFSNLFFSLLSFLLIFPLYCGKCAHGFTWKDYKENFISKDGRVIDSFQGHISHSEGQGYGMLLAYNNDDKEAFYKIWKWTKNNLQKRGADKLFCWSWGKRPNGKWQIKDYNNALDGDILIALALLKASILWRDNNLKKEAQKVIKDIRQNLSITFSDKILLLPGYYGFCQEGKNTAVTINPSYMIISAFKLFKDADLTNFWNQIISSSTIILDCSAFTYMKLPSDWVKVTLNNNELRCEISEKGPNFGFDAYRVFLYSAWAKKDFFKKGFEFLSLFFEKFGRLPMIINLKKQCISLKDTSAGMYAILGRYAQTFGKKELAANLFKMADHKINFEKNNYYSSTFYLLGRAPLK